MASYSRFLRRAVARGKKPADLTYKGNPHGGKPEIYEKKDFTFEGFAGKRTSAYVRGLSPFTKKGGAI